MKYIIAILISIITILRSEAFVAYKIDHHLRDSLKTELKLATTKEDSLRLALNLFDATYEDAGARTYGELSYALVKELNKTDMLYDLLGQQVIAYRYDPNMLRVVQQRIAQLQDGPDKSELETFVRLRITDAETQNYAPDKINQLIRKQMSETSTAQKDLYDKIESLFTLCIYLKALYDESDLLKEHYDQLDELINQLPKDSWFLPIYFYDHMAQCFASQFNPTLALHADTKLEKIIENCRAYNFNNGRIYRNMEYDLFKCYRRMLGNYIMLTPPQIEENYRKLKGFAQNNDICARDFDNLHRATIYYYMAREQYADALEILKEVIDLPKNQRYAYVLCRNMITAAQAVGDKEAELTASRKYIDMMQKYVSQNTERSLQELNIAYKINDIRTNYEQKAQKDAEQIAENNRKVIIGTSVISVILLTLIILLFYLWRKAKLSSRQLAKTNSELKEERDNQQRTQTSLIQARDQAKTADRQKTEFINLISHQVKAPLESISEYSQLIVDCIDSDKRKYLERFGNIVAINSQLIMSLVNDITEVSALESNQPNVELRPVYIDELCNIAIDAHSRNLPADMKLVLVGDQHELIPTDGRRIEQILTNLLDNAIKFSERGTITVSYDIDHTTRQIIISVADQGPGIPPDKSETIFDRFVTLDSNARGIGLGLYASRLLAKLLGGTVVLDPDYHHGARFVVTIPF